MEFGHIFEAIMLVCFGFSWPLNVIKAYKARTAKGSSLAFIVLIITGYVAGITAKFINHQFNYVLAVYFLNLIIVFSNVVVFFRNVALDNKKMAKVTKKKIFELQEKYKNNANYTYSQEENMNYGELNNIARKNGVILMGGSFDKAIPVTELAQSFEFNFELYNRSEDKLSIAAAKDFYRKEIAALEPEAVIIHLGDEDMDMFKANPSDFDKNYIDLISEITSKNKKMRLALISVNNPMQNEMISKMNNHIKAIADSAKVTFVNLDNAKLWNPKATKAATDFAYSMGLRVRKPLKDLAEILYSYACLEIEKNSVEESESLVG